MKVIAVLSALAATTMAQSYFGVLATRSGSPIHLSSLTARGGKFYLGGGPPSSYCPPQVGENCPNGTDTVLAGGYGTLSLGVVVPGGQQAYIAPDGSLSYTVPHSAYIPEGSVRDGFSRVEDNDQFGHLSWTNGFIACPTTKQDDGYQVFGQKDNTTFAPECLGFNALTVNGTTPGAWEY